MRRTIHTGGLQIGCEQWTDGAKKMDRVAGPSHLPGANARRRSTRCLVRGRPNRCTLMVHCWTYGAYATWCRTGSLHHMAQAPYR